MRCKLGQFAVVRLQRLLFARGQCALKVSIRFLLSYLDYPSFTANRTANLYNTTL